jgi:hypothetical protein
MLCDSECEAHQVGLLGGSIEALPGNLDDA